MDNRRFWLNCGIAGIAAMVCYMLAISIPWPDSQAGISLSTIVVSAWPIFSIIYSYGMYTFIAAERDGAANRLAFVFAALAFSTVLSMVIVQMAVNAAFGEIAKGLVSGTATALSRSLKMVDLGLDIAWDILIGVSMIFSAVALKGRTGFGIWWAAPVMILGVLMLGLNTATFPWPPGEAGLFDIGPVVGTYMLVIAVRFIVLARREPAEKRA
jgi:hypothetical protein